MLTTEIILFILLAYLTGAFPSAVWVGKTIYKIDVREFGSGNAGATNTFRVLGKKAGIPVLLALPAVSLSPSSPPPPPRSHSSCRIQTQTD